MKEDLAAKVEAIKQRRAKLYEQPDGTFPPSLVLADIDTLLAALEESERQYKARNILLLEVSGRGDTLKKEHVNPDALDGLVAVQNEFDRLRNIVIRDEREEIDRLRAELEAAKSEIEMHADRCPLESGSNGFRVQGHERLPSPRDSQCVCKMNEEGLRLMILCPVHDSTTTPRDSQEPCSECGFVRYRPDKAYHDVGCSRAGDSQEAPERIWLLADDLRARRSLVAWTNPMRRDAVEYIRVSAVDEAEPLQKRRSGVAAAFGELGDMFPGASLSIKRQEFYGRGMFRSNGSPFSVSIHIGDTGFSAEDTVAKAMRKVREWAAKAKALRKQVK